MRYHEFINEGRYDPSIFKAIFLAGGPGSGKSFISGLAMAGFGMRTVNRDDMFEYLMDKHGLDLKMPPEEDEQRGEIRNDAKDKTLKRLQMYIDGRLGIIIDSTGQDINKVVDIKAQVEELGYETKVVFVNTTEDVSQERNIKRPRTVPQEISSNIWNKVQDNIPQLKSMFGEKDYFEIDNSEFITPEKEQWIHKTVWKPLKKWISQTPTNPTARAWLNSF